MNLFGRRSAVVLLVAVCTLALVALQTGVFNAHASQSVSSPSSSVVGLPGYNIKVFATGTTAYFNPDSVELAGNFVFVGYQNASLPDGSNHKPSTIVQYTLQGKVVRTLNIPGHCDGLRFNPFTHLLWATSNEDANALLVTINPTTGAVTSYAVPHTLQHGGGLDDLAFINGLAFISASNPTLNSAGVNVGPALFKVTLLHQQATLTPVLSGDATATDIPTASKVTLNLTDPDSISIDSRGQLVLDSQGDGELVFLKNPGTTSQTVSRLLLGTQVDDSQWIPNESGSGRLVIVDSKADTIYVVSHKGGFTTGTVYTEAPSDSGVAGFVGTINLKTGLITPVIIGLVSPTGLGFIPA